MFERTGKIKILLIFLVLFLLVCGQAISKQSPKAVALFYTQKPPLSAYFLYDWVIVDPGLVSPDTLKKEHFWLKRKARIIGYLSVGEILKSQDVSERSILGKNPYWKSFVIDIRQRECQKYIFSKARKMMEAGFEGLMLDTLDSYQMVLPEKEWQSYEEAEIDLVTCLRKKYPGKTIIVNRPFRIIKKIHTLVDAFLAEGLFYTWDTKSRSYHPQKKQNTHWLLEKLREVQELGLPIIVVDYVAPEDRALTRKAASLIKGQGFIPWVTDKDLATVGVGTYELIPRQILFLYNGKAVFRQDPAYSDLHLVIQMPVEWLGFVPVFKDISKGLPDTQLAGRFAAVFINMPGTSSEPDRFHRWILRAIKQGVKVFFVDGFGFLLKKKYLTSLGIQVKENRSHPLAPIKIIRKAPYIGYESEPKIVYSDVLLIPRTGTPLILAENSAGQRFAPLALTPWGGYALEGSLYTQADNPFSHVHIPVAGPKIEPLEPLWVANPFLFFEQLLKPGFPVPDVTTEDGRRILIVHVDGDDFFGPAEFNPTRTTAQVLYDEIFHAYHIPQSVSVIEGEIAPWGINPKKSRYLEEIARKIFDLPWVEPASHTFSHPFVWFEENPAHLPVPNYRFDRKREIMGSIEYIKKRLLSRQERRQPLLFWSGDCLPPEKVLAIAYRDHILSINGGGTVITYDCPNLTRISPMGINKGKYFQVYAPIINENVYTNNWHGPYDGFLNVISTFKLTEKPRRLKPIDIYYHFFSGAKLASLNALKRVYSWALSQDVKPLFVSDYILKVLEFRTTALARYGNCWVIRNGGNLRTFRFPLSFRLDKAHSKGVLDSKVINGSLYLSMNASGDYFICKGH